MSNRPILLGKGRSGEVWGLSDTLVQKRYNLSKKEIISDSFIRDVAGHRILGKPEIESVTIDCVHDKPVIHMNIERFTSTLRSMPHHMINFHKLTCQLTLTLHSLHSQRISHRDITASNVFYDRVKDEYILGDFDGMSLYPCTGTN